MVSEAKPRDLFPKGDFKVVRKGYEPSEVDKYVARLRRAATDQLARVEALEKALADARESLKNAKVEVREELAAQMESEIAEAKEKAAALLAEAESQAAPVSEAARTARQTMLEAEQQATAVLAEAEKEAKKIQDEAAALRTARLHFHILDAEAQQHSLFRPLVHVPIAVALSFGHAQLAAVQRVQRVLDGFARLARGRGRDFVTCLPGGFDCGLKLGVGHGKLLGP